MLPNIKSVPSDHVEKLVTCRNNAGKQFTAKMCFIDKKSFVYLLILTFVDPKPQNLR